MLAVRVIPQLLCRGKQLIKGQKFNSWRSVGTAAQAVSIHQSRSVDELMLLDISATPEGRGPDLGFIKRLSCFSPLAVGGGVRSIQDIRDLLNNGADKVVIGTAGWENPGFVKEACEKFGSSTIVMALDVRGGEVVIGCGEKRLLGTPKHFAMAAEQLGAGEIVLTSIDREGTMNGYDLDLIRDVSSVNIPVVASGGCSGYQDMVDAVHAGASAVAAGALFQFTDATPKGASEYLQQHGIEARV